MAWETPASDKLPSKLVQQLCEKLGSDWAYARKRRSLAKDIDLETVARIEDNLRLLIPLQTCLRLEGFTVRDYEKLLKSPGREPNKFLLESFDCAIAEGEARALRTLQSDDLSAKGAERIQWLLERALEDKWAPRSRQTKTVTENKSVSVSMKLDRNIKGQATLAPAQKVLEAEVVKAAPELVMITQ